MFGVTGEAALYSSESSRKRRSTVKLTAVFQKVPEGYIGFVQELPGANTQAPTLEEARESLSEAVELVLEANRTLAEESIKDKDVIREPLIIAAE
jgi:predicted RNase H-like HicB family nuclease